MHNCDRFKIYKIYINTEHVPVLGVPQYNIL